MKITENIALFVGAGSIENAWKPIISALQPFHSGKFELNSDGANSMLANIVYLQRFNSKNIGSSKNEISKELLSSIKTRICKELEIAQNNGTIFARKALIRILEKFVVATDNRLLLISTNWDEVIENEINKLPFISKLEAFHIHGKLDNPEGIYLPSEIGREPYRSEEQQIKFDSMHGTLVNLIKKCHRAIFYGISLDPLDAELSTVVTSGLIRTDLKEIIIIDLKPEIVAQRLKVHYIGREIPKMTGYLPGNLNEKIAL